MLNDRDAAERSLKQALSTDPNNLDAYDQLARLYVAEHKLPEATVEFEKRSALRPNDVAAQTAVAILLELQHKQSEAKPRYQKALELDSHAAVAANNLAQMYADGNENLDVALQLAQTAKAGLPKSPEVDDTLGWVYYRKGLSTLAIASLKQCAAADPQNASYLYHLGLAYNQNGEEVLARQTLERALKLQPDFTGADEARKVIGSTKS
jgi:Flp pilus assembly protein TadD